MSKIQDENRPPVLAHLRFVAERPAFSGLDLGARFRRIHQTNLWGAVSSVSGLGSENGATTRFRHELPGLLRELRAASLLDAPCGDGGWISELDLGLSYTGVDIVPELVDDLRSRAEREGTARNYVLADITCDPLPRADAILCRDCLVHLSFSNIGAAVANFRRSGSEWLIATTFPDLDANIDCEDGDWRALNFERLHFTGVRRLACSWRGVPKEMAAGPTKVLQRGGSRHYRRSWNMRFVPGLAHLDSAIAAIVGHDLFTFGCERSRIIQFPEFGRSHAFCEAKCVNNPQRARGGAIRACWQGGGPHRWKGRDGRGRLA